MSSKKIVKSVLGASAGQTDLPALQFVSQYTPLAAALSKAVEDRTAPRVRDKKGNRRLTGPDSGVVDMVYRSISRRNKDNEITLQLLPDLGRCFDILVALAMNPKDMFSDNIAILSDSSNLLPSSMMMSLLQVVNEQTRKDFDLINFTERMLYRVLRDWGALPTLILPENTIDDAINNYNMNVDMQAYASEFDVNNGLPKPYGMLGVPEYLSTSHTGRINQNTKDEIVFSLEAFEKQRRQYRANSSTDGLIRFSKLFGEASSESMTISIDEKIINVDELVNVTDNFSVLKLPEMKQASVEARVSSTLAKKGLGKFSASLESAISEFKQGAKEKFSDQEIEQLIFKNRRFAHTPVAMLRSNSQLRRSSVGEPLIRELNTACFIPVSVLGDPTRKLGGFIMIDIEGNPLDSSSYGREEIMDLSAYGSGKSNFVSSLNQRASEMFSGKNCGEKQSLMAQRYLVGAFKEIVEKDFIDRMKNGQYTNGVQIAENHDFYWLMLTRMLKGQFTQLLWVPAEFMVYFALEYDEFGFGRSILDEMRNITSMRIMLMVSGITSSLRNSIGRTKVSIQLDEEEIDAGKTLEEIQDEIVKSRISPIPFGINNIADIAKYMQRACYEFEISGSDELPDMKIDFEQYSTTYPKPDEELTELLKNLSIQKTGLTPELVDNSEQAEFAIQIATSNKITMKQIQRIQKGVEPHIGELVRKYSFNSETVVRRCREIITNNYDSFQLQKLKSFFEVDDDRVFEDEKFKKLVIEQAIHEFIKNLYVELPNPGGETLDTQKEAFTAQRDFYEEALDMIINESFFDTTIQGEELQGKIGALKDIVKAHLMRDWMAKNNVLPELAELTTLDEEGHVGMNIMDSLEKHLKALGMTTAQFLRRFTSHAQALDKMVNELPDSEGDSSSDTSSSDDDEAGGSDDDDLFGGGDDFDMDEEEEGGSDEGEDESGEDNSESEENEE